MLGPIHAGKGCRGSAEAAVMGWPASVKQIFSPLGGDVKHGSWLTDCAGVGNPCRQAFEDWLGPSNGRSSWDPIAVMIAVRGAAGVHCKEVDQGGKTTVNEAGQEFWHNGQPGQSNQSRVVYDGAAQEAISFELNQLLCKPPGPWSDTVWAEAKGANCYGAHGATDLEHPAGASCGVMTIAECQQKCLDLPGCTAITTSPADGGKVECYRKADISVRQCDSRTTFDTRVRHAWLLAGGFNCCEESRASHPSSALRLARLPRRGHLAASTNAAYCHCRRLRHTPPRRRRRRMPFYPARSDLSANVLVPSAAFLLPRHRRPRAWGRQPTRRSPGPADGPGLPAQVLA